MKAVCTIISSEYLPLANALFASIKKQLPGTPLEVLVVDKKLTEQEAGAHFHSVEDLSNSKWFREIEKKYGHTNPHSFRWALKPVFISYLLGKGFDKILYVDADIYFVGNFGFLFASLDQHDVLLTPHWANLDPIENDDSLLSVLKGGMFNAGFIGANKKGAEIMNWWAGLCFYKTEDGKELGLFFDQKYLDILPVQFEKVHILRHRGCNLAAWNIDDSKRELIAGKLLINGKYEPIFIHFAKDTIVNILNRNDALLRPYLDEYIMTLLHEGFDLMENLESFDPLKYESSLYKIRHQLRLRTRIKRFFFKLAEKI